MLLIAKALTEKYQQNKKGYQKFLDGKKDKETRRQGDKGIRGQGESIEFSTFSSLSPPSPPSKFIFLTFAVILNFTGLILTNSRNAWVIAIVACLAYAFYQGWRLIVAFVIGIATSILVAAFAPSPIAELFRKIDILILNHGINVHGDRTAEAISKSYEVNTFSSWRLMELFLSSVRTNKDIATKEVWVNTSEAEVLPAVSPLYELSKRTLGDLVTLRRLDSPCVVRKLILGPFKSNLNPIGIMSSDRVAKQIVALAKRDFRNIIVTINPLTYLLIPIREFFTSIYFRFFSRKANQSGVVEVPKVNIKQ